MGMPTTKSPATRKPSATATGGSLRAIPASARIYEMLRERIVGGEMLPGAPVSEKELAERYQVSRTPVREALLRLADERLIDIFPQRGTFVSRINVEALRDGMVIREALERVAVRRAAAQVSDADIAELRLILERQQASERARDWGGFHAGDEDFHRRIAVLSGHPNLWRVARQEKVQIDRCRVLHLPISGRRQMVMDEHRAILDGLAARDPDAADRAMAEHLGNVLPGLDELLRARPDYFEGRAQTTGAGTPAAIPLNAARPGRLRR
ncbi:GntR family transcriptional regulator [Ancylobacter dichloromethanicus]|uniref:GntR family transcriptional regulator n=2 Tax=Ancylobacter dichloromethanicus TaxID=518825 RepID=A0A9W6JAS8_9HYPH|nr:GntR family transcriptional regulator [Ancylobacter dichloromethanicus]